MEVTKKILSDLAYSARLEFSDSEMNTLHSNFNSSLKFAQRIQNINTQNIEPMEHLLNITNIFREDVVIASDVDKMLALAPERDETAFVVPRVVE